MNKTFKLSPDQVSKTSKLFLTPDQVSIMLDVTQATVRNWCNFYRLGIKLGGRWRIDPDRLSEFISDSSAMIKIAKEDRGPCEKKKFKAKRTARDKR